MGDITDIYSYSVDIVLAVLGLIMCFGGYKLFKFSVTCAGAVIGYFIGKGIIGIIVDVLRSGLPYWAYMVIPVVFAIVFAVLAFSFYKRAFIFTVAAFVGRWVFTFVKDMALIDITGFKDTIVLIAISAVIGLAMGFAAYLIQRGAIIFFTSFIGSFMVSAAVAGYVSKFKPIMDGSAFLAEKVFKTPIESVKAFSGLLILILGVAGCITQARQKK